MKLLAKLKTDLGRIVREIEHPGENRRTALQLFFDWTVLYGLGKIRITTLSRLIKVTKS